MKILKFGGTSLGSEKGLSQALEIVASEASSSSQVVVVVSALSRVTDALISIGNDAARGVDVSDELNGLRQRHHRSVELLSSENAKTQVREQLGKVFEELEHILRGVFLVNEISPRTLDHVMGFGEQLSALLFRGLLAEKVNGDVRFLDARDVVRTDRSFGEAVVDRERTFENISDWVCSEDSVVVTTGFIARSALNEPTTLGRGGSDYTAALFGAALEATEVQIWTDVDGVLTADPRLVPQAFSIPEITYEEAMELSHFGAKVIYPPTMQPALDAGIKIRILNTYNPEHPGTVVSIERGQGGHAITGISSIRGVALLQLEGSGMVGLAGIASRLFSALGQERISVILISQASSEHSICFAIRPESIEAASAAIDREFELEIAARFVSPVRVKRNCSIIAVVGENMKKVPGISGRLFQALGKNGVNVMAIAQGSSELNISVVIEQTDEPKALNALHDSFFLSDETTLNIFLVGVGAVGSTLIQQISDHADALREDHHYALRVVALANTRTMLLEEGGIDLSNWRDALSKAESSNLESFVSRMVALNMPNSVFVDCTASDEVASYYEQILDASISIATPNKRANSDSWARYQELRASAAKANVRYFYETTVGAGLPVIGTINNLLRSGDRICRIEAVLSGTLSYIFNTFTTAQSFSQVVREAKERGFTEPDPRDDLSGTDVMRKLLILGRELGLPLEASEIDVQSLVPESCPADSSIDDFFKALEAEDRQYAELVREAESKDCVLRYIAHLEGETAKVSLQAVGMEHPFYSLSGTDNVISIWTNRYSERPLVVKGPGAGTSVTAAGVFADIVQIATYLT